VRFRRVLLMKPLIIDSNTIVHIESLEKIYRMGELDVPVLRGVDLAIRRGAFHAILGESGCGKTTLLNLLGALDAPTSGRIVVDGFDISALDERARTAYRQEKIGFIFQFFNLMPLLSALENVELGVEVDPRLSARQVTERAREVLVRVGLEKEMHKYPSQLSGGQQQRVAIARALAKRPALVLCDEPTGNLDTRTSEKVLELMMHLNRTEGLTFVIVTHSSALAKSASSVTRMLDGRVEDSTAEAAA
jgi:putative ABC transport system ATP-binding protein